MAMEVNRRGESGNIPYRSGRIFMAGGSWYFSTREAINHGPFRTREQAEQAVAQFLRDLRALNIADPLPEEIN